ncbi:MAG: hypothetical protein ACO3C1_09485 [Ilumatobacteraceae bacterium]
MSAADESLCGVVVEFDRAVGLGTVRVDSGAVWPFHCIEIADGSREIAVGARVRFGVVAKFGHLQAAAVAPD